MNSALPRGLAPIGARTSVRLADGEGALCRSGINSALPQRPRADSSADFSPPRAVAACGRRNELRAPPCSARVSDRANRSADFSPPWGGGSLWAGRNKFRAPSCSGRVSDALIGARTSVRPTRWRDVGGRNEFRAAIALLIRQIPWKSACNFGDAGIECLPTAWPTLRGKTDKGRLRRTRPSRNDVVRCCS